LLELEANIPRLEAKRFRRQLRLHPDVRLSVDEVYDLIHRETGSIEAAEMAAKAYMAAQLRAGQTPE
jgi:hypothetical protein